MCVVLCTADVCGNHCMCFDLALKPIQMSRWPCRPINATNLKRFDLDQITVPRIGRESIDFHAVLYTESTEVPDTL